MRLVNLVILGIAVALFLFIRTWIDRKREKVLDKEIVRDGDEYLGQWAGRSNDAFFYFRLKRDGSFSSKRVFHGRTDTMHVKGKYEIVHEGSSAYFPRLITVGEGGDTLFNFYLAYLTPYDSKVSKVDKMILHPHSLYDTVSYTFYRVK